MAIPSPAAGKTHNVVLRYGTPSSPINVGLMLPNGDLRLFQMQSYAPFAPAARQGEATNRDFSFAAVWELHNDFSGGMGHIYEQPVESGDYEFAQGLDASTSTLGPTLFSAKRKVLTAPAFETAAGSLGTLKKFIQFNGAWYAVSSATPGLVYKYDVTGVTPSNVTAGLAAACTGMFTDGTTLYVCQGASNKVRISTDGTSWSDAAYNANVLCQRDESIVVYAYGATLVPGTGYPDTVSIGWTGTTINGMVYFENALWIGKPEGLYKFQYGRVSLVFPVADQYNTANFIHMTVHKGLLYFNVQNSLFFTNGDGKFINMFPDDTNGFSAINGLFATFGPLLIAAKMRNMANTQREYLFLFDGPEHPGLNPIWSDADGQRPVVGCGATNVYDTTKVRVYLSQTTTGERYIDLNTNYEPNTYHVRSAAESYINLVEFSGGFRTLNKWWYEIVVNVRNPNATTYAKVYYSIDGGAWTQTLDQNGSAHTLTLSSRVLGTYLPLNTTGTYIQVRVAMYTTTSVSSAEISHVTIRGEVRVTPRYQISFPVNCSQQVDPLQGGQPESGEAIRSHLLTASQQGYPCKLQDPWGNWHLVSFRPPAPVFTVTGYETPTGTAPERMFTVANLVMMEVDPLGADGALNAWTPG